MLAANSFGSDITGSRRTSQRSAQTSTNIAGRMSSPPSQPVPAQGLQPFTDGLTQHPQLADELTHRAFLPGQPSHFATLETPLPAALEAAMVMNGVGRLWSHQVTAVDAARRDEDVLVTTPTASGKSIVFQLPVLEEAHNRGPGRALFLFPLKALGQDQLQKFRSLAHAAQLPDDVAGCAIYDGDTSRKDRQQIRANPPRVLISNPDMLHHGILSNAAHWAEFLGSLKWIVLDELHTYRGIFGCHFYHVLQRLLRVCRRHGGNPKIIASSATASNAAEFAGALAARPFTLIEESGAPREGRHFLLFQPSSSPYTTALELLTECVNNGLKTIVFTKARRMTELLHNWLKRREPELAKRVANYRAGFLASERRQIERDLFDGKLDAVISTSALEMGIDVGGLDACILVGFPGSMMATWQRSGRVGREGRESVTALCALPDALDQYLLQNPDEFLQRPCEPLIVSPKNRVIGRQHLLCAAAEMPLSRDRDQEYVERHQPVIDDLIRNFELTRSEDGSEIYCRGQRPHRDVSLRGGGANYSIYSTSSGRTIGTVDGIRALRECHPGAIYLHAGRQFGITELDEQKKMAIAQPMRVDYFTQPLTEKSTEILEILNHRKDGPLEAWLGRVRVTEFVAGFERKRIAGQERLGQEALDLDPVEFETVALWWAAPRTIEETLLEHKEDFMGGLHAAEHAAISLFPALALCDRSDIGGISIPFHPQVGCGAVFIYDGHAGGVGIAESGFERLPELLAKVIELLERCPCESGCPSCVQSPKCGNGNRPLDKGGALRHMRLLLALEQPLEGEIVAPTPDLEQRVDPAQFKRHQRGLDRNTANRFSDHFGHPEGPAIGGPTRDLFDLGEPGSVAEQRSMRTGDLPPLPPLPSTQKAQTQSLRPRDRSTSPTQNFPRCPIPRTINKTVLFDIETKRSAKEVGGWHMLHRLGVALAVTCNLEENTFNVYLEDEVDGLVAELRSADLVIGFNIIRFDYPVMSGYNGEDFRRSLPTLDLFETIKETVGRNIGLARLGEATLGSSKSADGLQSLEWYREGRLDLIEDYCRQDVTLLRDLYLFGRREGYVLWKDKDDRKVQIPVEWR